MDFLLLFRELRVGLACSRTTRVRAMMHNLCRVSSAFTNVLGTESSPVVLPCGGESVEMIIDSPAIPLMAVHPSTYVLARLTAYPATVTLRDTSTLAPIVPTTGGIPARASQVYTWPRGSDWAPRSNAYTVCAGTHVHAQTYPPSGGSSGGVGRQPSSP